MGFDLRRGLMEKSFRKMLWLVILFPKNYWLPFERSHGRRILENNDFRKQSTHLPSQPWPHPENLSFTPSTPSYPSHQSYLRSLHSLTFYPCGKRSSFHWNMECGIYPEPSFSGFEAIKIILKFTEKTVGSGVLSLRFHASYPGFLRCFEGQAGSLVTSCNRVFLEFPFHATF